MFKTGVKARKTQNVADFVDLYQQQSDVCMLRMFESFMESAPQLVLQLYIMLSDYDYSIWTGEQCYEKLGTILMQINQLLKKRDLSGIAVH